MASPTDDPQMTATALSLYYTDWCPYCLRVVRVLDSCPEANAAVELRDVDENPNFDAELREARGRGTVPVLRIGQADGPDIWMPESADIVQFLKARFSCS